MHIHTQTQTYIYISLYLKICLSFALWQRRRRHNVGFICLASESVCLANPTTKAKSALVYLGIIRILQFVYLMRNCGTFCHFSYESG